MERRSEPPARPYRQPKAISPEQIRKIKVLQRQVGLSDEDYRAMLKSVAGVSSCKELTGAKIDRVIKHLSREEGKGKREKGNVGASRRLARTGRGQSCEPMATEEQLKKIMALWHEVSRAPEEKRAAALRVFLKNRYKVDSLNWLTLEAAVKVIEGLKKMAGRKSRPGETT